MQEISFENVGSIYKFWYKIFDFIEKYLPYSLTRRYIFKKTTAFSDKWVIFHTLFSIFSVLFIYYLDFMFIENLLVLYAFIRILEIVVYQLNVLMFHPYKALIENKKMTYELQNQYRSVVLLGHNFLEVILWFTCANIYFNKPTERLLYTLMDNTIRIFTFNYEKVGAQSQGIQLVFFVEVLCGMILTIISLAKFIGELPHVSLKRKKEVAYRTFNTHKSGAKRRKFKKENRGCNMRRQYIRNRTKK